MKKTVFILALIFVGTLFSGKHILAAGNPITNPPVQYTALEPLPCIPGGGVTCAENGAVQKTFNFQNYVQYAFNLIIALAAAAAVFMIVYGGFQYMTTDSWNGKSEGISKLKNALLGLLLVLTSYLILRTVDPRLVAISSTLVKPLNITYTKNADFDIFSQMEQDAQAYKADMASVKDDIQKAKNTISASKETISTVDDEIRTLVGNPALDEAGIFAVCVSSVNDFVLQALCTQRAAAQNSISTATSDAAFGTAKGSLLASAEQCGSMADYRCFVNKGVAADVQNIIKKYSSQLNAQQVQELKSFGNYAQAKIDMSREASDPNTVKSTKINDIYNIVQTYTTSPNANPDLVKKLNEYKDTLKGRIMNG